MQRTFLLSDANDVTNIGYMSILARVYRNQRRYAEAEPLYQQALSVCEQQLRPAHPDTLMIRGNYTALLRAMRRDTGAAGHEAENKPSS